MALTVRQRIGDVLKRHGFAGDDTPPNKGLFDDLGGLAAQLIMEAVGDYGTQHDELFAYFTMTYKVRTMMNDRWVDVDPAEFPEYEGKQAHGIQAAGVEVLLPQRIPQEDGSFRDGAPMWTTLDKVELPGSVLAPPGRTWRVVIEGPSFRIEHRPLEQAPVAVTP